MLPEHALDGAAPLLPSAANGGGFVSRSKGATPADVELGAAPLPAAASAPAAATQAPATGGAWSL
jgi:hypothetical protein